METNDELKKGGDEAHDAFLNAWKAWEVYISKLIQESLERTQRSQS